MAGNIKVNKLFLIGNGLDLALGLKTSYSDFMFWLLKKQLFEAIKDYGWKYAPEGYKKYNDFLHQYDRIQVYGFSTNELFDIIIYQNYDLNELKKIFNNFNNLNDILSFFNEDGNEIKIHFKYDRGLFGEIYNNSNLGWVDIEETYFQLLKEILNGDKKSSIVDLNFELEIISQELKEYLLSLEIDLKLKVAEPFFKQFASPVKSDEITNSGINFSDVKVEHLYFLNFNYTETLSTILCGLGKEFKDYSINNIHGSLEANEPIIFGYGDEMDEDYKKIENLKDNEFLKHIKSFQYFKNKNYRNLLRFLNSMPFQVCIYGHSCDISDRVMLNEIFENENCLSIKVYHYNGKSDFINKTMNISRHFNSNKLMREKIVEFNPENEIPQIK